MGNLILRLTIWFLLTANLSLANIIIGVLIALILPRSSKSPEKLQDLIRGVGKILIAIPQAYQEAIELIFRPHLHEEIILEPVKLRRSPGMIFLDIFLITFTPKTTVLKYQEDGYYQVHRVYRRKKS